MTKPGWGWVVLGPVRTRVGEGGEAHPVAGIGPARVVAHGLPFDGRRRAGTCTRRVAWARRVNISRVGQVLGSSDSAARRGPPISRATRFGDASIRDSKRRGADALGARSVGLARACPAFRPPGIATDGLLRRPSRRQPPQRHALDRAEDRRREGNNRAATGSSMASPAPGSSGPSRMNRRSTGRVEALEAAMKPNHDLARQHVERVAFLSAPARPLRRARGQGHRPRDAARRRPVRRRPAWPRSSMPTPGSPPSRPPTPDGSAPPPRGSTGCSSRCAACATTWPAARGSGGPTSIATTSTTCWASGGSTSPFTRVRCLGEAVIAGKFEYLGKAGRPPSSTTAPARPGRPTACSSWSTPRSPSSSPSARRSTSRRSRWTGPRRQLGRSSTMRRGAVLARKYEASTERALFRNLKEFGVCNGESPQAVEGKRLETGAAGRNGFVFARASRGGNRGRRGRRGRVRGRRRPGDRAPRRPDPPGVGDGGAGPGERRGPGRPDRGGRRRPGPEVMKI